MNHKSVLMTLLILLPAAASGVEIVNKDGNKLDLYGQLNGVHYSAATPTITATAPIPASVSKARRRSATR